MAITVTGPDGSSIDFPEGTSEAEIGAAMAEAYPDNSANTPMSAKDGGIIGAIKGASRALETNLPFVDRAVAGAKSVLPQGYGGTGQDYATNLAVERAKNAQFAEQNPATNLVGGITASAPLAIVAGPTFGLGGLAGRMASSAVPFAAAGAAQGASNSPDLTDLPETAKETAIGAGTGGVLGAVAPAVASGVAKAISPFPVNATRQAFVDALRQAGIRPTAGQVTGNKTLQKLEAGASDIIGGPDLPREANNRAFTAALMGKAGLTGVADASQDSLNAAHEVLGKQFDALGERNAISKDPQLVQDLNAALQGYHDVTPASMRAPGIEKIVSDIKNPAGTSGTEDLTSISGDQYNNLRSQLGKTAQRLKITDPAQAEAYRGVQGSLDDAMDRSIAAKAQQGDQQAAQDLGAFHDVRSKYKNLLSVEQAAGSAGSDAALGQITPQQMRTALASGNNRRAYARGIGDLAPLTNAGNAILTNFPQSGTTPRVLAAHLLGAGIGGVGGYQEGGLPGAVAGALVPAGAARTLMSRPVQSILANQLMRGPSVTAGANRAALAAALAARPQLQRKENTAQ